MTAELPAIAIVERLRQTGDKQAADYIEWVRQWGDDWRKRAVELEDALNAADRFLPRYVQVGVFGLPKDNDDFRAMAKVYKALGRYVPRYENQHLGDHSGS
jgi:hypothetical protein